ncbi:MAG: hypothetical protein CML24_11710 [Rhizobiales bacterium]|nr:hypothetical protein [Hyphomicrobiales bacterium]
MNKFRRWLLETLADGDLVVINAEVLPSGAIRRKEAGKGIAFLNVKMRGSARQFGIMLMRRISFKQDAFLAVETGESGVFYAQDLFIDGSGPLVIKDQLYPKAALRKSQGER